MMTTKTQTPTLKIFGAIVAVLLLASALRIYHITQQSIWFDEAFAWNIIIQEDMFPRIATDTHPPLYYLFLRGWTDVAGDSALALRYLSALSSIMTVAFVVQIGRELAYRKNGWDYLPVFAGLMIALSDAEIFLAQEARNYSLYTFFGCWSMWFYLRWLRKGGMTNGLLWAVGNAGLAYTHYQGLFIPMVQGIHALLFLRERQRVNAVCWLALSGLPVLPWFVFVTIPQAKNAIDNSLPFSIPTNWETFLHLRDRYLGAIWALLGGLAVLGLWEALKDRSRKNRGVVFLLVMWVLVPFCVLFFGNLFAALLTERKLLIIAPAIALIVGIGLTTLTQPARGLVVLSILLYGVTTVDYYRVKESWEIIAQPALDLGNSGDLYLAQVEVGQYPMRYYWERQMPEGALFATFPYLGDLTLAPTADHPTFYEGHMQVDLLPYNQANKIGDVATAWVVFWSKDDTVLNILERNGYQRTMTITTYHLDNAIDLYRYDLLPEDKLVTYKNGMILKALEFDNEDLRIDLWWENIQPNFTTSAGLLNRDGVLVAQWDSQPADSYDQKSLVLAEGIQQLPPDDYTMIVKIYQWSPDGITDILTETGDPFYQAGVVRLD
jgi:hypothetical protein